MAGAVAARSSRRARRALAFIEGEESRERVRPGRLPRRVRHELAKGREVSVVAIRHARRGGLHRAHHAAVAADSRLLRLTNNRGSTDRGSTDRGSTDITIPAGRR